MMIYVIGLLNNISVLDWTGVSQDYDTSGGSDFWQEFRT